jgi:hypothetical protein
VRQAIKKIETRGYSLKSILFQGENMSAKRDQQAKAWIPLESGWQVFDATGGGRIEIVYQGVRVQ